LRAKRGNLAFNKINGLEIASSQKLLLAMTCDGFFNSLFAIDILGYLVHLVSLNLIIGIGIELRWN